MEPEQAKPGNEITATINRVGGTAEIGGQINKLAPRRSQAEQPVNNGEPRYSAGSLRQGGRMENKLAGKTSQGSGEEEGDSKQEKPDRIGFVTAGFMIVLAILFDLASIIPIVNIISTLVAWIIFPLWFLLLGIGFMSPKRLAAPITSVIVEAIPAVSIIPSITLAIILTIIMVKSEDKLGLKLPSVNPLK